MRPAELCPGCLAAIRRAQREHVRKLDPLFSPDVEFPTVTPTPVPRRAPMHAAVVLACLLLFGVGAVPANWLAQADEPSVEATTVTATIPAPLESVPTIASITLSATPRLEIPAHERVTHAAAHPARETQSSPRVTLAHSVKSPVRPARPQLAATSPTNPVVVPAAVAVVAPAPPVATALAAARPRDAGALSEALTSCAQQSMFARTWCEHQARVRYCEHRAGSPECSTSTSVDHGG